MLHQSPQIPAPCPLTPAQPATPDTRNPLSPKPLLLLRTRFAQWIRSITLEERCAALKIHLPEAGVLVRRLLSRNKPATSDYISHSNSPCSPSSHAGHALPIHFYQSLVFESKDAFLDHLTFDFSLLHSPEQLFDLLIGETAQQQVLQEAAADQPCLSEKLQKLTAYELADELVSFVRRQVLFSFALYSQSPEALAHRLEEERRWRKELSSHWKQLTEDARLKLLLLGHADAEALIEWLSDQATPVKAVELHQELKELERLEKNEFCNRVLSCQISRLLSPLAAYYEALYHHWRREAEGARRKRPLRHAQRDHSPHHKSQQLETSKQAAKQPSKPRRHKKRKANSVESNETNETEHPDAPPDHHQQEPKVEANPEVETELSNLKKSASTSSDASTGATEEMRRVSLERVREELEEMADRISLEANEYHERRVIAFQRIQFLLQYYQVPIKLFGSCASGIAVRNSDIDIAVDNSLLLYTALLPEPDRIRAALQRLQELLQTQAWITEIRLIKTAAIPLIKLTVDTSLPFADPAIGDMYFELNRPHNAGPINADITVETRNRWEQCSHLGLISTAAINDWLAQVPSLHSILILLKEFFGQRRLNCTYEGGLNTFSLIVLLLAYIRHAHLEAEDNAALVLEKTLRFYVEEFDERHTAIDILNGQSIFFPKEAEEGGKQKAELEIRDPMNQQKNMTRNCYSFHAIKALFSELLHQCFDRAYRELEQAADAHRHSHSPPQLAQLSQQAFSQRNVFVDFLASHSF